MKMNSDKCHLILSSNDENKKIQLNGEVINNTQVQKLLGVHIDCKLKFDICPSCPCSNYKRDVYKPSTTIIEFYNVAIQLLSTHLDVSQ